MLSSDGGQPGRPKSCRTCMQHNYQRAVVVSNGNDWLKEWLIKTRHPWLWRHMEIHLELWAKLGKAWKCGCETSRFSWVSLDYPPRRASEISYCGPGKLRSGVLCVIQTPILSPIDMEEMPGNSRSVHCWTCENQFDTVRNWKMIQQKHGKTVLD